MSEIRRKSAKALIWFGLGHYSTQFLSLLTSAVLGRLLLPGDFGLVGMILTINAFFVLFANSGLSTTVVQHREFTKTDLKALVGLAFTLGLAMTALLMLASPLIAWFFNDSRLIKIAFVVAPVFLITSLSQIPMGILQRDLKFQYVAGVNVGSSIISSVAAILLAVYGWAYWALIAQILIRGIIQLCAFTLFSKSPLIPSWNLGLYKQIFGFTGNLTLFQIVNYFHRNIDNILIGRVYGPVSLGVYTRAYLLLSTFNAAVGGVVATVLHSALARKQDQVDAQRRGFGEVVECILWISAPLMGLMAAFSPYVIRIVWGPGWDQAVIPFFWLALAGMHQTVYTTLGAVFAARYNTKAQFISGTANTLVYVGAIIWGLRYGIDGVAKYYSIASHLIFFPYLYYVWNILLKGNYLDFLRKSLPPMLVGWSAVLIVFLAEGDLFGFFKSKIFSPDSLTIVGFTIWAGVFAYFIYKKIIQIVPLYLQPKYSRAPETEEV